LADKTEPRKMDYVEMIPGHFIGSGVYLE